MKVSEAKAADLLQVIQQQHIVLGDKEQLDCPLAPIERCLLGRFSEWCGHCRTLRDMLSHPNLTVPEEFGWAEDLRDDVIKEIENDPDKLVEIFQAMIWAINEEFADKNIQDLKALDQQLLFAVKFLKEYLENHSGWFGEVFKDRDLLSG